MTTALDLNNPYSACELKRIRALEFGLFAPEFLKKISVCEVTSAELYENGLPKNNGLNDVRMGTTDYRISCGSCGMDVKNCLGHFAHIALAKPMYHYGFIKTIIKVLRCVCYGCSRLLADPDDPKLRHISKIKFGAHRLEKVLDVCNGKKRCEGIEVSDGSGEFRGGCGCPQPKYFKDGPNIMVQFQEANNDDEETQEDPKCMLSAEDAFNVLNRISESDMKLFGFDPKRSRPAWMIITVLPVPPPCVRPYVQFGSDRSEDDLTMKLLDIVKTNNQIKKQDICGAASHVVAEMCQLLQFHITTMFDNDIPGMPVATTRSKKPIKSIRARLKGKEGRLRGNLMGKRVDFSARTVITGDPNIPIDVVGVPKSVAMTLTFPETVTPLNYDKMKALVETGPHQWPGAKYITRDDGTRFDLRHVRRSAAQQLEFGYRVERHMQDGDYILFNRQPSLHKMSIMGHKAKILPYSTFRLNLSVTTPYNADFDGDEMNLHLAQSHETRAEIKHLMMVPKQIVSPQGNRPVMGIVQDSLLAVSRMTRRDTFLTREMMMSLLMWIPYWDGILPPPSILRPQPQWTGKQLITTLLSFDQSDSANRVKINLRRDGAITLKNDNFFFSQNDARVIISHNEHLAGIICKRTVGSSSGSLIHVLWHEAGPDRTKDFLTVLQKVVNNWLLYTGFSLGCSDIIAKDSTLVGVSETLEKSKQEVQKLVRQAQRGKLECQPGKSLLESFESRVNKELNEARETSGKIATESLSASNNILSMVNCGSKGSTINISQIMACVGQQNVEGKRIPFGFSDRSLPHFIKHDYGPESRGFVSNSYLSGLTPQEMFFHAMGGREGIIDTACKTSETGYIQRRLIKAMEDVMVKYDYTVRNSLGDILQFLYGEDGMNAEFVEDQTIELMKIDNETLEREYRHDFNDENYGKSWIHDENIRTGILMDFEKQSCLEEEFNALKESKLRVCRDIFQEGELRQHLPINIRRLIEFAKAQFPATKVDCMTLNPVEIAKSVNHLLEEKLVMVKSIGVNDTISSEVQENATILMKAHLRMALNSRRLMQTCQLGAGALEWLFGEIERQFNRAIAHPGECVGAIAAQSIGEPATQMTLNTFHFAGVGSKNVTLGVPRLKELINVAKQVKTPSLTVHLDNHVARDQEKAKDVQTQLEHTTLDRVTSFSQVYYDPDPTSTIVEQDRQWVSDYYEFPDEEELPSNLGPWLLRIQLTNKMMTDKKLTMKEIGERIYREFSKDEVDCIWTDDNSEVLVLRLRIKQHDGMASSDIAEDIEDEGETEDRFLQKLMSQCLANVTLRGIPDISKVYMREEGRTTYNAEKGNFERVNQWVLDTDGCNLEDVLSIQYVDSTRTTSNNITEIFKILGIEAVRRSLLQELRAVISFDGSYVNYRHLAILCDTMTQKGHLMPITRHGVNRIDRGPLMKCSFEETVEILMDTAIFAETDHLRGVTENIMLGQLAPLGTGDFDILIDEEKLKDANQNLDTFADISMDPFTSPDSGFGGTPDGTLNSPSHSLISPIHYIPSYAPNISSPGNPLSPSSPSVSINTKELGGKFSPVAQTPRSPTSVMSPMSPFSPIGDLGDRGTMFSPQTSSGLLNTSFDTLSPTYSPNSPVFTGSSPLYSPNSPTVLSHGRQLNMRSDMASITSPMYSPTSPVHSPTSPAYSPAGGLSPLGTGRVISPTANPTSPHFTVTSEYSPTSPVYSPTSPRDFVASPGSMFPSSNSFVVTSPNYSPTSPKYSPTSPAFSPSYGGRHGGSVPGFSVQSPRYSPTSPDIYHSPMYNQSALDSSRYSPTSPTYDTANPSDPFSPDPFSLDDLSAHVPMAKPNVVDNADPNQNETSKWDTFSPMDMDQGV